jgi:hypothetical protein
VLLPESISVPAPVLVSPPAPPIPWLMVVSKPLVSMVPPPALSVIVRVVARLKLAPNCSVPPLKVSAPVLAPRLLSAETLTMPALKLVPPE